MKSPALRLLVFLGLVVALPLLIRFSSPLSDAEEEDERIPRGHADAPGADLVRTPKLLADTRPDLVFMGNSMLNTRIDPRVFNAETPYTCAFTSRASTATAVWYLYLKNLIVPMEVKPKVVVIFFRDRFLTWPFYRTSGIYGAYLDSLRLAREPVLDKMLRDATETGPSGIRDRFDHSLRALYGLGNQPLDARAKLNNLAFDLTGFGVGKATRRSQMAIRFGLDNLRSDLGDDIGNDVSWDSAKSPIAFSSSPDASFLPHLLGLARENGFKLCFYRVKRRCDVDGDREEDPQLAGYLESLAAFIRAQGGFFIDESADPVPVEWYSDGDHIGKDFRPEYTRYFWKKAQPVLEPILSGATP